ncbi:diacylglycerol/lipid kinase family protein [Secundilactobacillus paracollinoides]|nr:YegS/Rv2252/BmrU family lipid kinase [Secundilactobacillus paracollinoides]
MSRLFLRELIVISIVGELIINKDAGNARLAKQMPQLITMITANLTAYHEHQTHQPGDANLIVKQLVRDYRDHLADLQVIVVGGDGTLHDVVNGLQEMGQGQVPIGYIPTGTGNDFARANHIPLTYQKAAASLATAEPRGVNVGRVSAKEFDTKYFINNFGIGIDALVVYATNHSRSKNLMNKLKLGSLSYPLHFATALMHQKAFTASWGQWALDHHDDRSYLCVFTNHPFLGGVRLIMPEDDDRSALHLVIVHKEKWQVIGQALVALLKKKPDVPQIHHYQGPEFHFETEAGEHIQVDGEELQAPLHVTLTQVTQRFLLPTD